MVENPPAPPPPPPPPNNNAISLPPIFNSPQLNRRTSANQIRMTQPDGTSQMVQMRNKRALKTISRPENAPQSPDEGSEAYGTGSSTAEVDHFHHHQQQQQQQQHQQREGSADELSSNKPGSRHSRLFRLLQDSDYSDSDSTSEASKKDPKILTGRDSAAECDTSSVASSAFSLAKGSPVVTRRSTTATAGLRPSASFCLESPNSTGGAIPKYPATRVWSYLREEFDNSSPQSGAGGGGGRRSSSSYDATRSPKQLHMELLELATFPSASKEEASPHLQQY